MTDNKFFESIENKIHWDKKTFKFGSDLMTEHLQVQLYFCRTNTKKSEVFITTILEDITW
jgi:hypothetical protein